MNSVPWDIDCPSFVSDRLGMQIDFYVSHDLPIQSLSGNNDGLLAKRKKSEAATYSFSYGARFGFTFPSGMGIKSGINFSKIRIKFKTPNDSGVDTSMVSATNTYSYVDIPLLFSYEMSGIGPFYYAINFGPVFNITLTPKGQYYTTSGISPFTRGVAGSTNGYKKEAGIGIYGSFGLHYLINNRFDLVFEPNIRFNIGSIANPDYPIDENYSTVGIITGLRYKF